MPRQKPLPRSATSSREAIRPVVTMYVRLPISPLTLLVAHLDQLVAS